jgi:hypothetical protein
MKRKTTDSIFSYILRFILGTLLVAQLVEALRYKSDGRGFDSRWCHWNFDMDMSYTRVLHIKVAHRAAHK